MSEHKKKKFNLILSLISVCFTVLLLVMTLFGWYVTNSVSKVEGIKAGTNAPDTVKFEDTIKSVRYSLSGDITTDTYTRVSSGSLYLTKRVYYNKETNTTTTTTYNVSEKKPFYMSEMLPGEYIDITIGYYLEDSADGVSYSINLNNVTGGSFTVDNKTHYVTGAFKWANISLKDANDNYVFNYTETPTYNWMSSYSIDASDTERLNINMLNRTWNKNHEKLYYTFRIYEDFTQYYTLISKASESVSNLLSEKVLNISEIFFML